MQRGILNLLAAVFLFVSCQNNKNPKKEVAQQIKVNDVSNRSVQQYAFVDAAMDANNYKGKTNFAHKSPEIAYKNYSDTPTGSLKNNYRNYFLVGTAVNVEDLDNPQIVNLIKNQFSSLSPKKALQPLIVHPSENVYKWDDADKIVNFAQTNNIKLRGHCLVYDIHMPKWFYKDGNKTASKDLILQRMKDHITTIMTRYKGKMYCWDVVNEAMRKNDSLYAICGEDYITKAFEYAHQADPSAKLFYNDGIYNDQQRDKFYKLIKKWKSQGVPIDGIGIQYHLGIEGKSADDIQKDIDEFSSLGLQVQITELDISIYPRMSTPETVQGTSDAFTPNVEDRQADIYKTIFEVCKRNKGKVTAVTVWGVGDGDSFLVQKLNKKNYPYLFTNNLQPKKAFKEVIDLK